MPAGVAGRLHGTDRLQRLTRQPAVMAVPPPALDQAAGHGLRGWAFRHRALDGGRLACEPI